MRHRLAFAVLVLALLGGGCGPSTIGTGEDPAGDPTGGGGGGGGGADAGAFAPDVCLTNPDAKLGAWCEFDPDCCGEQLCLAGQCSPPPGPCATNDDCPVGFLCSGGTCVACVTDLDCAGDASCLDGVCTPVTCPDGTPDLVGTWQFRSQLDVSAATSDFVLDLGDAAAEACEWLDDWGFLLDLPAWGPDLICLIGDLTLLLHDMDVEHRTVITETGPVTWHATDTWTRVIFDPGGRNVEVDPADLECPIVVDDFDVTYSCGVIYLDRHHVDLALNGLVQLLLDVVACQAMEHSWGCSWDAALDQVCASIGDPALYATCVGLIAALVIPDPCFSPTDMTLAGTATITGAGQMAGDWAGTLGGDDFTGTFTATRP